MGELTQALRRMAADAAHLPREDLEAILLECDNLAYSPKGGHGSLIEASLKTRALAVADQILGSAA